jgi:hypothetical protein
MRDQFISGLTSEQLRVKLIGKGHRHKDGERAKVTLREVVEVAKTFEATTATNQLTKTARETQVYEQVNYNNNTKQKQSNRDPCFWCSGQHKQPRPVQHIRKDATNVAHSDILPELVETLETCLEASRVENHTCNCNNNNMQIKLKLKIIM